MQYFYITYVQIYLALLQIPSPPWCDFSQMIFFLTLNEMVQEAIKIQSAAGVFHIVSLTIDAGLTFIAKVNIICHYVDL